MNRSAMAVLGVALVSLPIAALVQQAGAPPHQAAIATWPVWGGDTHRSWSSPLKGSGDGHNFAKWSVRGGVSPSSAQLAFYDSVVGDIQGDAREEVVTSVADAGFGIASGSKVVVWDDHGVLVWERDFGGSLGAPVLVDIDRDGKNEVFVAHSNYYELLSGNGQVIWNVTHDVAICGSSCAYTLASDITGDDVPDFLLAGYAEERVVLALNGRDGSLIWKFHLNCGIHPTPAMVIERQGEKLVVVGCHSAPSNNLPGALVYAVRTRPRTSPLEVLQAKLGVLTPFEAQVVWTYDVRGGGPRNNSEENLLAGLTAGDLTGDGIPEIVVGQYKPHGLHVVNLDGALVAKRIDATGRFPVLLANADLDGDRRKELIESTHPGVVTYGLVGGELVKLWDTVGRFPAIGTSAGAADLDGDGAAEVIVGVQTAGLCEAGTYGYLMVLDGKGELLWMSERSDPCTAPSFGFAFADLNRDGALELLFPSAFEYLLYSESPQPMPAPPRRA